MSGQAPPMALAIGTAPLADGERFELPIWSRAPREQLLCIRSRRTTPATYGGACTRAAWFVFVDRTLNLSQMRLPAALSTRCFRIVRVDCGLDPARVALGGSTIRRRRSHWSSAMGWNKGFQASTYFLWQRTMEDGFTSQAAAVWTGWTRGLQCYTTSPP